MMVKMTEALYRELCDSSGGVCLGCGALAFGDTEPDAEEYHCDECDENKVQGIENALISGNVVIAPEGEGVEDV